MDATGTPITPKKARKYRAAPPPPKDVALMTRIEAAAFFGVSLGTWGIWERDGRITILVYRVVKGTGRTMYYTVDDLTRLREEFRKLEEPYPDPDRPGCYRVPIRSRKQRMEAIIDAEDLPKVQGKSWNWRTRTGSDEVEIVLSSVTERVVPLKRIIMEVEDAGRDVLICHVNDDPLDCRRANLARKTGSEVARGNSKMAVRAGRPTSSKYKGVLWDEERRLWKAQIGSREQHRQLGRFRDEVEAALAYDAAAREMYGEHAGLNFSEGTPIPARTGLGLDGQPVREKCRYNLTPPLPPPPEGVAVMTREEAAEFLGAGRRTFCEWERNGHVAVSRYRVKAVTGTPILYAVADLTRLRDELDKVGKPYPDPQRQGCWRVPLRTLAGYIEAIIDAEDLHIVQGKLWNYTKRSGGGDERGVVIQTGSRDTSHTPLKRIILGVQDDGLGILVVHANGDPLDCRRCNLVLRTASQRTRRGFKIKFRAGKPTTSRYKGVCWSEREGKWVAQIRIDDVHRRLGLFDDEIDAANAYDEAARQVRAEEARVNFPDPGELPSAVQPTPLAA